MAIQEELLSRQRDLEATAQDLDREVYRWTAPTRFREAAWVVPDTNVFLHHESFVSEIDWHYVTRTTIRPMADICLVVPMLVVDELDNAKRTKNRSQARQTVRWLHQQFAGNLNGYAVLRDRESLNGGVRAQLLFDPPGHIRLPHPDDELVDRAAALGSLIGKPVEFVSFDNGALFRAESVGLRPHRLLEDGD